jgi:signal peptidase I
MNCQGNGSNAVACSLAGEIVQTFGEVRLRVFGTSMAPSILPGDLVSVQRAGLSEISPGEIVLFTRKGGLAVHRVVARTTTLGRPSLITRGDRLRHNDPPVSSSEFLGRVHFVERGGRRLQPAARPGAWERMIGLLLRSSDRATSLYLRLAAPAGTLPGRAECQA